MLILALDTWFSSVLGSETFHADVHAGGCWGAGVCRGGGKGGEGLSWCSSRPSTPGSHQCRVARHFTRACVQVGIGVGRGQ